MLQHLKNLACYCGLSKEDYNSIKKDAYVNNFIVWKYIHALLIILFTALFLVALIYDGFDLKAATRLVMLVYSILTTLLFFFVMKEDSIIPQFMIYLTMIMLFLTACWIGLDQSGMMAVSFIILLVMMPMFMIDKPYFMTIFLCIAGTIYLLLARSVKSGEALRGDVVNTVMYGLLGIIVNTFYNRLRVRELLLQRQNAEHLREEERSNAETRELYSVLSSMTGDYESFLLMDLITAEQRVYRSGDVYANWAENEARDWDYPTRISNFAARFVLPQDRADYEEGMQLKNILAGIADGAPYCVRFRTVRDGNIVWMESRMVRHVADREHPSAIMGIRNIDTEVREEIKRRVEQQNREMQEIVNALAEDFECVDYVELGVDRLEDASKTYRASTRLNELIPGWETEHNFHHRLNLLNEHLVAEQDRDTFLAQTRRAQILHNLEKGSAYTVNFRIRYNGNEKYYQYKFKADRSESGELRGFIAGIRSVDSETRTRLWREAELAEANERAERTIIRRTAELNEKNRDLIRTNDDIVEMLGDLVEFRDRESGEHVRRVKQLTNILATQVMKDMPQYELTPESVEYITSASALHDIGKIVIPDSVLLKPGKFTPEEFEIMKTHTSKGCEMLQRAPDNLKKNYLQIGFDICRYHHEKWDGKGYPEGLKGDEIPIAAQIVSVADCYDALTTKRTYKEAYPHEQAFRMILEGECGAFSDGLMACFRKCEQAFSTARGERVNADGNSRHVSLLSDRLSGMKILLVDDEELSLELNEEILASEGAEVVCSQTAAEALKLFEDGGAFDAIITDLVMPEMDGFELTRRIREIEPAYNSIPIICLTADDSEENIRRVSEAGADACMAKPLIVAELTRILLSHMRTRSVKLEKKLQDTIRIASTDALTHVKSIAAYTDMVAELTEMMTSSNPELFAVVMCDLNGLKGVNDTLGHDAGDRYIINACRIICEVFDHSPVFRIGGDEFVAILQGADYRNRNQLMKKLKEEIARAAALPDVASGRTSIACGISEFDPYSDYTVSEVVKRADAAMYATKKQMKA